MNSTESLAPSRPSPWDENAAFWVEIIRHHRDKYRTELTDPAVRAAIGLVDGLAVLDAGCGEGYMGRWLAQHGATSVHGLDASANLIVAARRTPQNDTLPLTFDLGTVDALPYADDQFDLVTCNHVLNDLPDPTDAINEFGRVLRPGGRLVVLMLHPCFYNKHTERGEATNASLAENYFMARSIEQPFVVDGLTSPAANTAQFRPLEFYTEALRLTGFAIAQLTEPHPSEAQLEADPWWREKFTRPLFMVLAAVQLGQ